MNIERRWKHFAAMVLIGDGVMALTAPRHDASAWRVGPKEWQRTMGWLRKHPLLTRAVGAAQIAAGVCWALSTEKEG